MKTATINAIVLLMLAILSPAQNETNTTETTITTVTTTTTTSSTTTTELNLMPDFNITVDENGTTHIFRHNIEVTHEYDNGIWATKPNTDIISTIKNITESTPNQEPNQLTEEQIRATEKLLTQYSVENYTTSQQAVPHNDLVIPDISLIIIIVIVLAIAAVIVLWKLGKSEVNEEDE